MAASGSSSIVNAISVRLRAAGFEKITPGRTNPIGPRFATFVDADIPRRPHGKRPAVLPLPAGRPVEDDEGGPAATETPTTAPPAVEPDGDVPNKQATPDNPPAAGKNENDEDIGRTGDDSDRPGQSGDPLPTTRPATTKEADSA